MRLRSVFFLSGLACASAQSCYYPNGALSTSDAPCTDGSGDSFCCSSSYYCLSNRLCQWQDGRLYRGSCTDEDWSSGNCPQFCQNNNPGNGIQLFQCSISLNTYCCSTNNSDPNSCCSQEGVQLITLAAPTTIGQIVSTTFVNLLSSSTSSTTTTRSSSSSSTTSTSSETTSTSSGTRSTSSASDYGTASGATSGTSSAVPAETSGSGGGNSTGGDGGGGSNTGAIAGGAVGGIAVVGALGLGAWWLWLRKRKGAGAAGAAAAPNDVKDTYQYYGGPQGGYYQSAPQHEPREMDGGQHMVPQEMDSSSYRQQANAWHELPAESMPRR